MNGPRQLAKAYKSQRNSHAASANKQGSNSQQAGVERIDLANQRALHQGVQAAMCRIKR